MDESRYILAIDIFNFIHLSDKYFGTEGVVFKRGTGGNCARVTLSFLICKRAHSLPRVTYWRSFWISIFFLNFLYVLSCFSCFRSFIQFFDFSFLPDFPFFIFANDRHASRGSIHLLPRERRKDCAFMRSTIMFLGKEKKCALREHIFASKKMSSARNIYLLLWEAHRKSQCASQKRN